MVAFTTNFVDYINYYGSFYDTIGKTLNLATNYIYLFDSRNPDMFCLGWTSFITEDVHFQRP